MATKPVRVSDLTVDELLELVRAAVREVLEEQKQAERIESASSLELPVVDVGPWPEGLTFSREEMYDDDER